MNGFVGGISQGAADTQAVVVSEIAANFPNDHGNAVSGETYSLFGVKVVNGLDQANAAYLKQIVQIFAPVGKFLHHT